ncbi:nitrous oxide reductase accessory protein NosL [Bacillus marinisedimentorum]|uniref:nitrous oxide reductase accessory protein NosL n=1 Tax=Bacillus marinisedimentorum TaxID=1821260 RepID=UPI0009F2A4A2|nr:nitrous oxide reductase accessory protein NosL [Bacillus marinisedimentorum]
MRILKVGIVMIAAVLFILAGCGKEQSYEPEKINPDIDACIVCNMSVAHTDYATQLILEDGTVHKFDDIGCMMEYINGEGKEEEIKKKYVRDVETAEWVELEEAGFAYDEDFWTPMAYGVLSFESEEKAKQYIEHEGKGRLLSYQEITDFDWEGH